jgi:hypothetical protein
MKEDIFSKNIKTLEIVEKKSPKQWPNYKVWYKEMYALAI